MKEYLKMSDVFKFDVSDAGIKVRQNYIVENIDDSFKPMEYAAHAINSHDELVEMNNELLTALEDCVKVMSIDLRGLKLIQPELSKAIEAIAKTKGGMESQQNALRDEVYVAGGKA